MRSHWCPAPRRASTSWPTGSTGARGTTSSSLADEFPSNLYPWMQQASTAGSRPAAVATDGGAARPRPTCARRCDEPHPRGLGELGRLRDGLPPRRRSTRSLTRSRRTAAGALFFLDAIQGLGRLPARRGAERPVDFLAADGHKWLLGPEGAGVAYCEGGICSNSSDPIRRGLEQRGRRGHDFGKGRSERLKPAATLRGGLGEHAGDARARRKPRDAPRASRPSASAACDPRPHRLPLRAAHRGGR